MLSKKMILSLAILLIGVISLSAQDLYINEFMADNSVTIADPQGEFEDWVEIYNAGATDVDLGGMYMGDDHQETHLIPTGYPETIIPAGGFLIVWYDKDSEDGPLHVEEKLGGGGDEIYLWDTDGITVIDSYTFGPQTPDVSEGRVWDGADSWMFFDVPTPEASNGDPPSGTVLYINEFMASNDFAYPDPNGEYDDWIEIYNAGTEAVDIGGMYITDDLTSLTEWQIPTTAPDSTTIPAGDFLVLWADKQSEQGVLHVEIKLSGGGEQIGLTEADGVTVIDSLTYSDQTADISYGRYPDGDDNWEFMPDFTPEAANISSNTPPIITEVVQDPMAPTSADIVNVTANITDDGIIGEALLKYNSGLFYVDATMYDDGAHGDGAAGDNVYGGYIPAQGSGVIVNYYVEATDNLSTSSVYPEDAPAMTLMYEADYIPPELYINEFMASNETTLTDPQGEYDDWIEIYNPGTGGIDIGGMYITDDLNDPSGWWQIPSTYPDSTTIPAGEYLLLWADKDSEQGVLHVELKLSGGGEEVGLYAYRGSSTIDTIIFGEQYDDVSYGRYPDGSENWEFMFSPTPNASNVSGVEIELAITVTDSVNLTWTVVSGAASYNIYRSTDPYPADWGAVHATVETAAYSEAATGTKYFYLVKASTDAP